MLIFFINCFAVCGEHAQWVEQWSSCKQVFFFYFFGCTQVGLTTTNSNSTTTAINTMTTIKMCITLGQGCPKRRLSPSWTSFPSEDELDPTEREFLDGHDYEDPGQTSVLRTPLRFDFLKQECSQNWNFLDLKQTPNIRCASISWT